MSIIQYNGTGRRKTSVARVLLRPGKGAVNLTVNKTNRVFEDYFPLKIHKLDIMKPFTATNALLLIPPGKSAIL